MHITEVVKASEKFKRENGSSFFEHLQQLKNADT
jgi:hypothetical protein